MPHLRVYVSSNFIPMHCYAIFATQNITKYYKIYIDSFILLLGVSFSFPYD